MECHSETTVFPAMQNWAEVGCNAKHETAILKTIFKALLGATHIRVFTYCQNQTELLLTV